MMPMDRAERKDIYRSACREALEHFTDLAIRHGESFNFEDGFKGARNTFLDTVRTLVMSQGSFSDNEAYDLSFDGWEDCGEFLRDSCRKALLQIEKDRSVDRIRRVTAEAVVEPRIQELGYPYLMEYQRYRLKISLRLTYKRHFEFYVKYSDMGKSEIVDDLVERTKGVIEYIQVFGPHLRLTENEPATSWSYPPDYIDISYDLLP